MKLDLYDNIWGIFVIFKREFLFNLKSIRMVILMIIFTLLVLLTVFGSYMAMGMSSDTVGPELSELMIKQGPVFILSAIVTMVILFGPLIPLALSFDTIVKEKNQNSIGLLLCRPVGKRSIAIGKFLGIIGALSLPIILVNTIAIIVIMILSGKGIAFNQAGGFILYTLIFLAIYASLGQLISSVVKTTTTAILLGIVLWIFLPAIVQIIGMYISNISSQIALFNPSTPYSTCISHALGTFNESSSQAVPLWAYYISFILWLIIPLFLAIEIFHRKED